MTAEAGTDNRATEELVGAQSTGAADGKPSLLRRKLQPRRKAPENATPVQPPRADPLGRAFARACNRVCPGLHARARAGADQAVALSELTELVETDGFLALLEPASPAEASPAGLACLDQGLFAALIEHRATGRLSARAGPPRAPTLTDTVLVSEVLDDCLATHVEEDARLRADTAATAQDSPAQDSHAPRPWRVARLVPNARLLEVLLEDGRFALRRLSVTLSCGEVTREGAMLLALPVLSAATATNPPPDTAEGSANADWQARLGASVMQSTITLRGVLARVPLPLGEALALTPGSVLTLPLSVLEDVRLEGGDTQLLAHARLGQYRGMRALRLTAMREPDGPGQHAPQAQGAPVPADSLGAAARQLLRPAQGGGEAGPSPAPVKPAKKAAQSETSG